MWESRAFTALPDRLPAYNNIGYSSRNYLTSLPLLPSGLEVLTVEITN